MSVIKKGKRQLIALSIIFLVIAVLGFAGGIWLTVSGAVSVGADTVAITVVKFIFGIVLIVLGLVGIIASIVMLWTGGAIKATNGSLAEGNEGIGTANMTKCQKCGNEVSAGETFCGTCGASLEKTKKCPKCGADNKSQNKHCSACGEEM